VLKRAADNPATQAFADFLRSNDALKVIRRFGYAVE